MRSLWKFYQTDCCIQISDNGKVVTDIAKNIGKTAHVLLQTMLPDLHIFTKRNDQTKQSSSTQPNVFNHSQNFFLVYLIYNVVLITAVQQSDSIIHILYSFSHILFYYGLS